MKKVTLGGDNRVGSGNKMKVALKGYERSTHDLGYIFRSTQAPGTLVPFINELGLNGDTFDIELSAHTLTHPTIGPLFGSFKQQMDVYVIPIRLYQGLLNMDATEVGMNMKNIKLPQLLLQGRRLDLTRPLDNQHTNPSSILAYLGIRGCGNNNDDTGFNIMERRFAAMSFLAYYDVYKQYYANKQEEIGVIISGNGNQITATIDDTQGIEITWQFGNATAVIKNPQPAGQGGFYLDEYSESVIAFSEYQEFDYSRIMISTQEWGVLSMADLFLRAEWLGAANGLRLTQPNPNWMGKSIVGTGYFIETRENLDSEPQLKTFDLKNIDQMRIDILRHTADGAEPFMVDGDSALPYGAVLTAFERNGQLEYVAALNSQEGLAVKTYQSDLFNNWLNREWIAGENGINELTRIDTTKGYIAVDEIIMANKVYNILNRVAVSGGTYGDWQEAVWGERAEMNANTPMYMGGLIKELQFQEVVSTAATSTEQQPLGTLAGRGSLSGKHKGGKITIKVKEPSIILGLNSFTPRLDYSQGNHWINNLKTPDDFHKPGLDGIGFQDLITDQMAWWDTIIGAGGAGDADVTFKAVGKQPAWLNYQTNVNKVLGNFADETQQMYMVLNRRYESLVNNQSELGIKDLTTYIDPAKFNYIFADVRRDAQNIWVQIGVDMTVRRKMSAKVMPNL